MRGARLIAAVAAITALGCDPRAAPSAPPEPAEAPLVAEPAPRPEASAPADPPEEAWLGAGEVRYLPAILLAERDGIRLEKQSWIFRKERGRTYRASQLRPGALSVRPSPRVVPLPELAPSNRGGAWAAINGGFYERDPEAPDSFRPMGVVRSDGSDRAPYHKRGGSGVLAILDDGPVIVHRDAWAALKQGAEPREALQSIDRIVDGGESLVNPKPDARQTARSAVALSPERVWIVTAFSEAGATDFDGGVRLARTGYSGLTLGAFASYIAETTGAEQALNLDGSISTAMMAEVGDVSLNVVGEKGTINAIVMRPPAPKSAREP